MQIHKKKKLNCRQTLANGFQDYISMRSASFALHMDWLSACNQRLLKHDWSILLGLQTDHKRKPERFPLPTDSADIYHMQISVYRD